MTNLEFILSETVERLMAEIKDRSIRAADLTDTMLGLELRLTDRESLIKSVQQSLSDGGYRIDRLAPTITSIIEWERGKGEQLDKMEDDYYMLRGYVRCEIGREHNDKFVKMLNSKKGRAELKAMKNKSGK